MSNNTFELSEEYKKFHADLISQMPEDKVFTRLTHRLAHSTDASIYRFVPQVTIKPTEVNELSIILKTAHEHKLPFTFIAAGTSLAGETGTDSILIALTEFHDKVEVIDEGKLVTAGAGALLTDINQFLKPYKRTIDTDYSFVEQTQLGGFINTTIDRHYDEVRPGEFYAYVKDVTIMLSDGTIIDSKRPDSIEEFRSRHQDILTGIEEIRQKIMADSEIRRNIEEKARLSSHSGYRINAFLRFSDPMDILFNLIVGSEGTLACVLEATYQTISMKQKYADAIIFYYNSEDALNAAHILNELYTKQNMKSLHDVQFFNGDAVYGLSRHPKIRQQMPQFEGKDVCALVIDMSYNNNEELKKQIDDITNSLSHTNPITPINFTTDPDEVAKCLNFRKYIMPAIHMHKRPKALLLKHDVIVELKDVNNMIAGVRSLLHKYDYLKFSLCFGHTLSGYMYFVFTEDFHNDELRNKYQRFMDDLTSYVYKNYNGSVQIGHSTGRLIAPYLRKEWGDKTHNIMKDIKKLFDPENLMNPDVVVTDRTDISKDKLKIVPVTSGAIDQCSECGLCDYVCPSAHATFTPRQRISTARNINFFERRGNVAAAEILKSDYEYMAVNSCTHCDLCTLHCPVFISPRNYIQQIESKQHYTLENSLTTALRLQMSYHSYALRWLLPFKVFLNSFMRASKRVVTTENNKIKTSYNSRQHHTLKFNEPSFKDFAKEHAEKRKHRNGGSK